MKNVLFVVTTNENMGDLAFCLEWTKELGQQEYQFAFVMDRSLDPYVPKNKKRFFYAPQTDVKETILQGAKDFEADVLTFATGSCWKIQGQTGAKPGRFIQEVLSLNIPILSFDPFEGYEHHPPPQTVIKLRDSPNHSTASDVLHYNIPSRFNKLNKTQKSKTLESLGLDPSLPHILFPISQATRDLRLKVFSNYYAHLAHLFESCSDLPFQFVVIGPNKIKALDSLPNVHQIGEQPFADYLKILRSMNLVLTDYGMSAGLFYAACSGIPAGLLCNPTAAAQPIAHPVGRDPRNEVNGWETFKKELQLDRPQVEMIEPLLNQLKDEFVRLCLQNTKDCGPSPLEHLAGLMQKTHNPDHSAVRIEFMNYLTNQKLLNSDLTFLDKSLQNENRILQQILQQLTWQQRKCFRASNTKSLLDIQTGYDPFDELLYEKLAAAQARSKSASPRRVKFIQDNVEDGIPGTLVDFFQFIERRYHLEGYVQLVDIFDIKTFSSHLEELLSKTEVQRVQEKQRSFQTECEALLTPAAVLETVKKRPASPYEVIAYERPVHFIDVILDGIHRFLKALFY